MNGRIKVQEQIFCRINQVKVRNLAQQQLLQEHDHFQHILDLVQELTK